MTRSYNDLVINYQLDSTHIRRITLRDVNCDFYINFPEGTNRHGSNADGDQFFIPLLWKPFLKLGAVERVDVYGKCMFMQIHLVHYEEVESGGFFGGGILSVFGYVVTFIVSYFTFGLGGAVFLTGMSILSSLIENPILRLAFMGLTTIITAGIATYAQVGAFGSSFSLKYSLEHMFEV